MTWIALLRGINVGGHNKIRMADLREMATELGWRNVRTYIQSGNLLFESDETDKSTIETQLSDGIERVFALQVPVVVRSQQHLVIARDNNPYEQALADDRSVHVVFLSGPAQGVLDPDRSPPDTFTVVGDVIYVHYPNGSARSKLTLGWFEKQTGQRATARNWRTLQKLIGLATP